MPLTMDPDPSLELCYLAEQLCMFELIGLLHLVYFFCRSISALSVAFFFLSATARATASRVLGALHFFVDRDCNVG